MDTKQLLQVLLGVLIGSCILLALILLGEHVQNGTIDGPTFKTVWTSQGPITVFGETELGE